MDGPRPDGYFGHPCIDCSPMDAPKMKQVSDDDLTERGGRIGDDNSSVLLIACGAIAREVLAVTNSAGLNHITLQCLPAKLHNEPDKITPAAKEMLDTTRGQFGQTFILYADCGTGGQLFDLCKEYGVEMLKGPHCYSFFEGNGAFEKRTEADFMSFYLTDFLVRQFEAFVVRPLGLDRNPELREMYFGNYEKLVYQVQVPDPALDKKAEECAEFLGLAYERIETGYGDLQVELKQWLAAPD